MEKIQVNLGDRSYPLYLGENNLGKLGTLLREIPLIDSKVAIVTNPKVGSLYEEEASLSLKKAGFEIFRIEIPDGEEYKSLAWVEKIYDQLILYQLERNSALIALGGGVIGDITGFVAATFLRGIPFIQVPTTLLAQVDSSVGGKTGINHPQGKNLIGAFYQPKLVLMDVKVLRTLEPRELKAGMAEVIKYGIIQDQDLFAFLKDNLSSILALESKALQTIIKRSCGIKAKIVEGDEREAGLRSILNFGHTLGHAIETLTDYKTYKHGEAVGIGMVGAAQLSHKLGVCERETYQEIKDLIEKTGLPAELPRFSPKRYGEVIRVDKKVKGGKVKFVLVEEIGKVKFSELEIEEILSII